jgi:CBS domain-containing protein
LSEGECFPLGALLGERAVTSVYRSTGDTFCFRISAEVFRALMQRSAVFADFATRRLANLLAQNGTAFAAKSADGRPPLERTLAEVVRPAVTRTAEAPLRDGLAEMRDQKADAALITDADGAPRGVFTLRDLRDRVALGDGRVDRPIGEVMTRDPVSLPADAMGFEAALAMARHGFNHVVVASGGRAVGIVSEGDLFALQRIGLSALSSAIRTAGDVDSLAALSGDVRAFARQSLGAGMPAGQLTRIVSALNDLVTARVVQLQAAVTGVDETAFCWIALGSEGRHEQTLATDQDNGILFPDPPGGDADAVRARLLGFARGVNEALARCGFPLCRGEVMASNPRWCRSLGEWRELFDDWMRTPDGEALLNATIFFDFRPIAGAASLAARLRDWLCATARGRELFLRHFATDALRDEVPLGVVRDFVTGEHGGRADTLDLKVNGAAVFIDAARVLALAAGVGATSTVERLRDVAEARRLAPAESGAWIDAFLFIQQLRLSHQMRRLEAGERPDNFVAPGDLNALERRILKESLRQARKLQERLRLDWRL